MQAEDITPDDLLLAYRHGIFPMAESADDPDIFWMDPEMRGIIPLDTFHIPASLSRAMKRKPFTVTINRAFDAVIDGCAARTPVRSETWINPQIKDWYKALHRMGYAHSIECWDRNDELAGGLYGIAINAAFFGESMFSRKTNASRIALVHLVQHLKARGFTLLDCQFVNPHLVQFGCVEITRAEYHSLLESALGSASGSASGSTSGSTSDPASGSAGVSFVDSSAPVSLVS